MRRIHFALSFFGVPALLFALFVQSANASTNLTPEESATLHARAAQLVSQTPGTRGVFQIHDKGGIAHIQSGAGCPLFFYGYAISGLEVHDSKLGSGSNVSCIYTASRPGDEMIVSYFRVDDGVTLDTVFEKAKREMLAAYPEAQVVDPAMKPREGHSNPDWADMRSSGFAIPPGKAGIHAELVTGLVANWAIELRTTAFQGVRSERDPIERGLFNDAPYTLFMLEAAAINAHATGPSREATVSSGQSPSQ